MRFQQPFTVVRKVRSTISAPSATVQRLAATATADPKLEPDGLRSRA
jgi:hypothetical protein